MNIYISLTESFKQSNTKLGPDPFHTSITTHAREVMPDRTIQDIVNKIFPWMKPQEVELEREFYANRGIKLKTEYAQEEETKAHAAGGGGRDDGASSRMDPHDVSFNIVSIC